MSSDPGCRQPAYHNMHLCILQHISPEETKRLKSDPEYRCQRCHEEAHLAKNLCQPKKI